MNMHGMGRFLKWLLFVAAIFQLAACGSDSTLFGIHPAINSANTVTFNVGAAGTFTVTATGIPKPALSETGALPSGVTFNAATGVLSGTPAAGSSGNYPITFTAVNGILPSATQSFTLVVASSASTSVLIVHDSNNPEGIDTPALANLSSIMTAAGFTVTANVGVPAGDLSGYRQIWDIRFDNTQPLSASDDTAYTTYLAGGGTLFLIGENTGFPTRNNSITTLISALGGGTVTVTSAANAQTIQAPFTGPNAVTNISYESAAGTANPGTGTLITKDASNIGSALLYDRGTLTAAPNGRLLVIFDVNFLDNTGDANSQSFVGNLVAITP